MTVSLCCSIFNTFQDFIHAENGGDNIECTPEICSNVTFIDHLKTETNALGQLLTETENDFEFDKSDTGALASLLVFAYIGRHYTNSRAQNNKEHQHLYFKFHAPTQMLRAVQPHCMFERSVYLSMIIVTVLILIFLLLARHLPKQSRWWPMTQTGFTGTGSREMDLGNPQGDFKSQTATQHSDMHSLNSANHSNHSNHLSQHSHQAIDFGGLRHR